MWRNRINPTSPRDQGPPRRAAPGLDLRLRSLMWNPGFEHDAAEPALLHGWASQLLRLFAPLSRHARAARPVLGLDHGGACRGMAFRIPAHEVAERCSISGSARWRAASMICARSIRASATVRSRPMPSPCAAIHTGYAGRLSIEETARLILQGIGGRGHCREYLAKHRAPARMPGAGRRPPAQARGAGEGAGAETLPCP